MWIQIPPVTPGRFVQAGITNTNLLPCSSEGEQTVDNRQVVRSIRTTATNFSPTQHALVAEPGYARVSETRVHRDVQVRPLPGAPPFHAGVTQRIRVPGF